MPPYLRIERDVVYLHVKVQPRASRNEVGEVLGNELKVKITAPPVDSAANEALVEFIADRLDCSRSSVRIVRGATSRHKVLAIRDVAADTISAALTR